MALAASQSSAIPTKAKPQGRPVSRSLGGSEPFAKKQKGCEWCGLAAPSNESKGFYKSDRLSFRISQLCVRKSYRQLPGLLEICMYSHVHLGLVSSLSWRVSAPKTLGQAESPDSSDRVVLDMDSSESPVHGEQEGICPTRKRPSCITGPSGRSKWKSRAKSVAVTSHFGLASRKAGPV